MIAFDAGRIALFSVLDNPACRKVGGKRVEGGVRQAPRVCPSDCSASPAWVLLRAALLRRPGLGRVVLAALLLCEAGLPHALANDRERPETYEDKRLDGVLVARSLRPHPDPEGKRIAYIRIAREDVFQPGELVPDWFEDWWPQWYTWGNYFHFLTVEDTVRREHRFSVGEPFRASAAAETARNLRSLGIFALVRVVPVVTEDPTQVGVVVYTRDIWSLRLETVPEVTDSAFYLRAQLVERNLFGRNKRASVRLDIRPLSLSIGQQYFDYRLGGGRLSLSEEADVILNADTGEPEGGIAKIRLERPFYNLDQRWSYGLRAGYLDLIYRRLQGSQVVRKNLEGEGACDPELPTCVPWMYDFRQGNFTLTVRRRVGYAYKQTVYGGLSYTDSDAEPSSEAGLAPELEAAFAEQVLPKTRREIGPFLGYQLSLPRFAGFRNLGSYGRTETVRVGPSVDSVITFPLAAFGSSTDGFRVSGTVGYVLAGRNALLDVTAQAGARLEHGRVVDQFAYGRIRGATPPWFLGRLVWSGRVTLRRRDTAQTPVALGNDNVLRGYLAGSVPGAGMGSLISNLELRSLPVEILSVHLGVVFFHDAGGLFTHLRHVPLHHSVGMGLRVLFPQLNSYPFRLDVGLPVGPRAPGLRLRMSFGGDQVVPLSPAEDRLGRDDLRSL